MMSSDTDIIDLTILPPPLTPDEEKLALSSMPSGASSSNYEYFIFSPTESNDLWNKSMYAPMFANF